MVLSAEKKQINDYGLERVHLYVLLCDKLAASINIMDLAGIENE